MTKDLKKRTLTSIVLFLLLFFSFINNYILGYVLIIAGLFSVLEFLKMAEIIFKKKKLIKILINSFFFLYIFYFFTVFFFLSFSLHLKILIFVILLTCVASDIGGFVFGKTFKGPKLTRVSPKKTIAGAIGSLIFSAVFILLIIYYFSKNFQLSIIFIGLLTSISCQIGDLLISYLKRKSSLKDTGNFLPGHGGVLDRIDGMLLGIPLGFLTLLIVY